MAIVTAHIAEIDNGVAYIAVDYDDVTMVTSRIRWANLGTQPVLVFVTAQDGTPLLAQQIIQPGTAEQSQNIPVAKRWHVGGTDEPAVNLAT